MITIVYIVNLIKHFPRVLYFLIPVLIALRVEGVEVWVHVGLADKGNEVVLGEAPVIALRQVLDGLQVILSDLNVVTPAQLQVLGDCKWSSVGNICLVKYVIQSYKYFGLHINLLSWDYMITFVNSSISEIFCNHRNHGYISIYVLLSRNSGPTFDNGT